MADVGYTFGYYQELNPSRSELALLKQGIVMPKIETACELGFGQGMSIGIHAAASPVQWHGTDFNPSQAGFAQELVRSCGSDAKLYDEAFEEFCLRSDLPDFDFIGLHGIWSWISDKNRALITDFIKRKLKVGGVLYISYNTLPGWAAFAPMRHLMSEHAQLLSAGGKGIISGIDEALAFTDKLLATNPLFGRANPQVAERLKKLKEQNKHYLAHEFFNRDWHPMHFATMAGWLQEAKLNYACSAHYLDSVDGINLTEAQQALLRDIPDPMFAQSVRDFMVNQQFRRDYWIKGVRRLSPLERMEALSSHKVMLLSSAPDITLKVNGSLGAADMNQGIYAPIIEFLADHKQRTLAEICDATKGADISQVQVIEAVTILAGSGHLASVQDAQTITRTKKKTEKLNRHLMRKARSSTDVAYLASPVTGGGHNLGRFQQLFALSYLDGIRQPSEWAQSVLQILNAQGQKIVKEGRTLNTDEENFAELLERANQFKEKQLPVLKALEIV